MAVTRCPWCQGDPLDEHYHDTEWGVPEHDDWRLFEALTLEGAQAGLSWRTILHKREGYRRAFLGFDPVAVAAMDEGRIAELLTDASIVRHRGKIESTVSNARAVLEIQARHGSLAKFIWQFVDGEPRVNQYRRLSDLPGQTDESRAMSKQLKKAGFRYVGPTTCYAFMQAAGMVNDHLLDCHRHPSNLQARQLRA